MQIKNTNAFQVGHIEKQRVVEAVGRNSGAKISGRVIPHGCSRYLLRGWHYAKLGWYRGTRAISSQNLRMEWLFLYRRKQNVRY